MSGANISYNSGVAACETTGNNAGVTITFPNLGYEYTANIRVRAYNSCGWSGWFPSPMFRVRVRANMQNCSGGMMGLVASPNPAATEETITSAESVNEKTATSRGTKAGKMPSQKETLFSRLQIINSQGSIVQEKSFGRGQSVIKLDISQLKPGIYTVRAFNGTDWQQQKMVVAR